MTLHNYLLFVTASIVLVLAPGPDMIYMLSQCIAQGRKAGLMAALGFNLGGYAHLTAAVMGLSAILATSSLAFALVKWIGAAYLIYLGIMAFYGKRGSIKFNTHNTPIRTGRTIFWQAFLSDALNPKVAIFFLALLPQFINAKSPHQTAQIILLGITVNRIALAIIVELNRNPRRICPHQRHHGLKIVFLCPADAKRFALNPRLHFQFGILDQLLNRLGSIVIDPLIELDFLADRFVGRLLDFQGLHALGIDAALDHLADDHRPHGLQLRFGIGRQRQLFFLPVKLHRSGRPLEIIARADLLLRLRDRVVHFLKVQLRDDVE